MSKTKELMIQMQEDYVNSWDAIDADYFYQKFLENNAQNLSV
jgi:hypothetical protein